jgi:hypothetical protein
VSLATALELSSLGFAVLPVAGKRPLTPRGVHSASTDPHRFEWDHEVGVATGGLVDVLDVDVRLAAMSGPGKNLSGTDGFETLRALGLALPATWTASTPSGGRHYWFKHVEGSRSRTLGPGLEWFSTGKFVVVPPAPGRIWLNQGSIAEAPEELRRLLAQPNRHFTPLQQRVFPGPLMAEGRVPKPIYSKILRLTRGARSDQRRAIGLWSVVARTRTGRNAMLNWAAFVFRELVADGAIEASGACELLLLACEANGYLAKDGEEETRATIMSGLGLNEWPLNRGVS